MKKLAILTLLLASACVSHFDEKDGMVVVGNQKFRFDISSITYDELSDKEAAKDFDLHAVSVRSLEYNKEALKSLETQGYFKGFLPGQFKDICKTDIQLIKEPVYIDISPSVGVLSYVYGCKKY